MVSVGIIVAAVAVGVLTGLLAGMLGVGGGTVLLPVFRLVFGMDALGTTATSLFTIIPTSVSGAVSHVRGKTCVPKLGIALGVGGALTSPVGVRLAEISPSWAVMIAASLAIGYSSFTMLKKALALPKVKSADAQHASTAEAREHAAADVADSGARDSVQPVASADAEAGPDAPDITARTLVAALFIGAIVGVASGYIGLGGGFLMIPLMLSLMRMPMKLASGTSLIAIMILAIPATVTQCLLGNVRVAIGLAVACGSIPAAFVGAKLTKRVPERALRLMFAVFLLFAALCLVAREIGLLG